MNEASPCVEPATTTNEQVAPWRVTEVNLESTLTAFPQDISYSPSSAKEPASKVLVLPDPIICFGALKMMSEVI